MQATNVKHCERVIVIAVYCSLAEKNWHTKVAKWHKSKWGNAPMRNGKTMLGFKFWKT